VNNTLLNPRNCSIYDTHDWCLILITQILLYCYWEACFSLLLEDALIQKNCTVIGIYKKTLQLFIFCKWHIKISQVYLFFTFSTCKCLYFSTPFCAVSSSYFFTQHSILLFTLLLFFYDWFLSLLFISCYLYIMLAVYYFLCCYSYCAPS